MTRTLTETFKNTLAICADDPQLREKLAWAAGVFEGEGCFSLATRSDRSESKPQACAVLRMTDEDIVHRFYEIIGVGSVSRHEPSSGGTKPFWQWSARGHDSVLRVVTMLWPWLGMRRRFRAEEVVINCARPGTEDVQLSSHAVDDVILERLKQDDKWGIQNHDPFTYLAILTEEIGELAQAALHTKFGGKEAGRMREEAVHTAAVALAIVECIDRDKWNWGGDTGKQQS